MDAEGAAEAAERVEYACLSGHDRDEAAQREGTGDEDQDHERRERHGGATLAVDHRHQCQPASSRTMPSASMCGPGEDQAASLVTGRPGRGGPGGAAVTADHPCLHLPDVLIAYRYLILRQGPCLRTGRGGLMRSDDRAPHLTKGVGRADVASQGRCAPRWRRPGRRSAAATSSLPRSCSPPDPWAPSRGDRRGWSAGRHDVLVGVGLERVAADENLHRSP